MEHSSGKPLQIFSLLFHGISPPFNHGNICLMEKQGHGDMFPLQALMRKICFTEKCISILNLQFAYQG